MLNESCGGRRPLPHLLSLHSFQSLLLHLLVLYQSVFFLFFCMSSQEEVVTGDSSLVLIEVAAIYNISEQQTSLISGSTKCPFAQSMRMKVAGWVTLSKAEVPLQIYTIHPAVGFAEFSHDAKLLQTRLSSKLSVHLSRPGSSQGGCYHKGPICYPGFSPSQRPLFGTFIYQEKLLMWAWKCSLRHYAAEAADFPSRRFKLNEAEAITQVKKKKGSHLRRCELPWTFKLRPGGNATADPYVNILCTNCTAAQSAFLDGVGTSPVGGSSY